MSATISTSIIRPDGARADDELAVEEPLEIRLAFTHRGRPVSRNIAITMRTPGHDHELAVGFLFGEGIIEMASDVAGVEHCGSEDEPNENVVKVTLASRVVPDLARLQRNFYTTSSCGVCGKSSLEALDVSGYASLTDTSTLDRAALGSLEGLVSEAQEVFRATGGLHAAALFDADAKLVCLREDVGRHNALDKVVGWAITHAHCPLTAHVLYLSGRASFELLQKALAAGISIVCAVGAPSSLAVDLADQFGITLLGFVRGGRFNIYTHPARINLS